MTSRERVLAACHFQEPDRIPVDLGGSTGASSIHVRAYDNLRRHLGLPSGTVTCNDIMQMLAVVEGDIRQRFGLDVAAIDPTSIVRDWDTYPLVDGLTIRLPAGLDLARQADGTWVLTHPNGKR